MAKRWLANVKSTGIWFAPIDARCNDACCYHPCDRLDAHWTFGAAAQEASVAWELGRTLPSSDTRSGWTREPRFAVKRSLAPR